MVRVDAPVGALVELTGTFNDWAPLTVPRVGDAFELTIELPRGTHRIAVASERRRMEGTSGAGARQG